MDLRYRPDVKGLPKVDFRPYMIQTAYDYYSVAATATQGRMGLACVLSALSLEICLKSFFAVVAGNPGKLNESYQYDRALLPKGSNGHGLFQFAEALAPEIRAYLFDRHDLETLEVNSNLFTSSRYTYEPQANQAHDDDIIKLAAKTVCNLTYLYRSQGCQDPFISGFDIDKLYFSAVQRFTYAR
ncbi:hypothetical protein [Pseudomonas sp. K2I15]|uniref:hypothetical protein n=1 Tax=Pseudomonas sp. K2I15 TaxID=2013577 RepID=UPI000B4D5591|nr:hypothetical protein [Pseudomonas sp. K2I15]OWP71125.1 hypothetical protein CEC48_14175 [Pseudomonas sp. K2I15]